MADLMARRFAQMGNEPRPVTVSGGIASFEAETTLRLRNCKVTLAPTTIGINAVSVTVCGKNLLDITRCGTGYITNNGQRYTGYDPYEFMDEGYLPVAAGEQLTFSMNQNAAISFALYNPGTKSLNTGATETTGTDRTTPVYASDRLIRWSACPKPNAKHGSVTDFLAYEPMIEIGGEATAYEAYHGQTYTVELPVTVYGGTVDLAAGKLVSTHSSSGTLLPNPVTYDIPKTNIKPSIGVNNVWSDAGTMEVTYWVKSTGSHPHLVTATDPVVINIARPEIPMLKVAFLPKQSGSGTPSPSNVRPVTGYDTITASIGSETFTASLVSGRYGGTVDLVSGVMTVEWGSFDLGDLSYFTVSDGGGNLYRTTGTRGVLRPADWSSGTLEAVCSVYTSHSGDETYRGVYDYAMGTDGTGQLYIYDSSRNGLTAAQFKDSVSGIYLVYKYINPQTVQLTPQTINALRGRKYVSSNDGSVQISYYTY